MTGFAALPDAAHARHDAETTSGWRSEQSDRWDAALQRLARYVEGQG